MESKCEHCGEVHGVLLREEKRENGVEIGYI